MPFPFAALALLFRRRAILIERFCQHLCNRSRIRAFNLETVQRKHRLAIAENCH